ncbi:MAG: hypothetical protein M1823_002344 [Watsoniomyces obsoletus]|nr:MAG: hypothetical protein M1823_002344 [Watsoniomyces obsoletus]
MVQNKAFIFKSIPDGFPVPGKDIVVETGEFDLDQAPPAKGLIVKVCYVSFDPAQRGRMRPAEIKSYLPAYELGEPIANMAIAKVLKSDNPKFQPGDVVEGYLPAQEYAAIDEGSLREGELGALRKLENPYNLDPMLFLGPLGMTGLTAYSSLYEIGKPQRGETIWVSAASGAVGQIVGQLAKHEGLKVIGSVGDDDKLEFIKKDLGFDEGFNYKKEPVMAAIKRLAPDGIDIYYENVGGEHLDAALANMRLHGRIVASGMISQYNVNPKELYGVKNMMAVVAKRLTMRGFIVFDSNMGPLYAEEHQKNMQKWLNEGTFKATLSPTNGIDNAPDGFVGMLKGKNFGKAILKIADLDD